MNAMTFLFATPDRRALAVILGGALAALLAAQAMERLAGLPPCALCYSQRHGYWAAAGLALAGLVMPSGLRPFVMLMALAAVSVAGGIAAYHAGVEWGFWPGPSTCSGGLDGQLPDTLEGFASALNSDGRVVQCDEAPIRILGLSIAGWNVVYATGLSVAALLARRGLGGAAPARLSEVRS